jgi:S1-C subfamily serine protease
MERDRSYSYPAGTSQPQVWLMIVLLAVVSLLFLNEARSWLADVHYQGAQPRLVAVRGELASDEQSTIALFKAVAPSVVYITSVSFQKDCFYCRALEVQQGTGSGFIWDANGYVVTNYHVIADTESVQVALADQSAWKARLVGSDPDLDIAVLKIDAPRHLLPPIPIGTSSDLQVGQKVFAIGNPFGFDQTLTSGIISGLGREITGATNRPIRGVIQTDAAINPGNSGGPLLDSAGRVIGINAAILSPSGAYAGIGFATPVDALNRIVPRIIRGEQIQKPRLGIIMAEDYLVRRLGLEGALILTVTPNGAADKAGLLPTRRDEKGGLVLGDRIIAIDGEPVRSTNDLFRIIDSHKIGDTVRVTVMREDRKIEAQVKLQSLP